MMPNPTEIDDEGGSTTAVPATIRLRYMRLAAIVGAFTIFFGGDHDAVLQRRRHS